MNIERDILDVNIDVNSIKSHEEYGELWNKLGKIEIKMVEKNEECKHNVGDMFIYETPYKKPEGVCNALLHVLELYTWRVALGFPSWNSENRKVYRIHCPDSKGTVWEMRKISDMSPKIAIREINDDEIDNSARIIRESFSTVAQDFLLTPQNCPSNPAFITSEALRDIKDKGVKMFGMFYSDVQIGFVAIEKADNNVFYMEKLSVNPEFRHSGYGRLLMDYVVDYVKSQNGAKLSIGLINENEVLKKWYCSYGFVKKGSKKFGHLPFTVCFMEKEISN